MEILIRLQQGLERMYRIDTQLHIGDFLIDADARKRLGPTRMPREQLLLTETEAGMDVGLFVDDAVISNLNQQDPSLRLDDSNFADFLLAIEGVSHFVYLVWCARRRRSVSALELELQAEVDKYVTCLLTAEMMSAPPDALRRRLFEQFAFEDDLDEDERSRYRAANANAHRYSASIERRFVHRRRITDMLAELRRFYRLPLAGKLEFIANAA